MKRVDNRRGQVLLEALVALGVLTAGFLGILNLLNRSLSLNRVIADNYTATYLAIEGQEIVKNLIDHNILSIANGSGVTWNDRIVDGCYEVQYDTASMPSTAGCNIDDFSVRTLTFDTESKLFSYDLTPTSQRTTFRRLVQIQRVGQDELSVKVTMKWLTRGQGVFTTVVESRFFNWNTPTLE